MIRGVLLPALVAAGLACGLALPSAANPRPSAEFAVATDAKLEQAGEVVRLTMALSRPIAFSTSVMAGPDRIVIDLPSVNIQVQPGSVRTRAGFASGFRFGLFSPDRSRIVIDLSQPATVIRAETVPRRGGFADLVVELKRANRAEFAAAVRESAAKRPETSTTIAEPTRAPGDTRQVVVIDAGHGGIDPGAVVSSIAEKAVVLAFAQALRDSLSASGRFHVVMTRDDDSFVSLRERVRIARSAGAHLFLSIHADSLTQAQEVRGATVYTGSERATDAESARLAAKENEADAVAGLDSTEDIQDVAGILMDLAKRETRTFSSVFARNLVDKLGGSVKMHKVPLRSAGFRVLSAPDVPSVLIELGYMSSPKDAELLNSPAWRARAVTAVHGAIETYFEHVRAPGGKAAENRQ